MRSLVRTLLGLVFLFGLAASGWAAIDLAAMQPSEIEALQKRLTDGGCYAGPIDGQASAMMDEAVRGELARHGDRDGRHRYPCALHDRSHRLLLEPRQHPGIPRPYAVIDVVAPTLLSDFPWVIAHVSCKLCRRRGQYRIVRLAARYGAEIELERLLDPGGRLPVDEARTQGQGL